MHLDLYDEGVKDETEHRVERVHSRTTTLDVEEDHSLAIVPLWINVCVDRVVICDEPLVVFASKEP